MTSPLPLRWVGLIGGILLAVFDTFTLRLLGIELAVNGQDATWPVAAYFGFSFAVLGFMVGFAIEARRRDHEAARVIQAQSEALRATRMRLAQHEKLATLGQLASAIAHEVRNPLAVMRSATQTMLEGPAGEQGDVRESCTFVIDEIDRLHRVVTSLLAFAKPVTLTPRAVETTEVLGRALQLAREEHGLRDVRIRMAVPATLPALRGDPDLLCQVLLGLVDNGVEAAGDGGEVSVEAAPEPGGVSIAVADSGPGIPTELRDRVFEPFFTTREQGTGLGLAVVRQIVRAHRGSIDVGERDGGGARFVVHLPAGGSLPEAA